MKASIAFVLICLFSFIPAAAQTDQAGELSKLEAGRRILGYFSAFNSGDEKKLKAFFEENLTPEALSVRPVEPRLEFHRLVREDHQTLKIEDVVSIEIGTEVEISLFARGTSGGWLLYKFRAERKSPQKLLGWQIEETDGPSAAESEIAARNMAEFPAALARYLDGLSAEDRFAGVVLVAKNTEPIFKKAYGLADQQSKRANDTDTKFNLGSINKVFTKIAIGRLIEQKKLSIDDKIGKILPDYPNKDAREKVTIRHLLSMTSGIGDIFGPKFEATPKSKLRSISDFLPLFASEPLAFEPGSQNQYSNGGFVVLGAIIEKISGMSYHDYVRKTVFEPTGMNNTDSYESDKKTPNMAEGYTTFGVATPEPGKRRSNFDTRPARGSSAGGGYSTAGDLLKFSLALQNGKLRIPDDSGNLQERFGGFGIAGGSPGVNGVVEITPEGYTVIVLSNYDPPAAERIGGQIIKWLRRK